MKAYSGGHFNSYMKKAIKKYGLENFEIEILEKDIPIEKLTEREQYWIDYYDVCNPNKGYNMCPIAGSLSGLYAQNPEKHPWVGRKHTVEEKEKISKKKKHYETHNAWCKGKSNPKQSESLKKIL